jgi:flagellar hook-associated protein 3 FlgL
MISNVNGATQQFLADLDRIQATAERAQREISSGLRVEVPSDAPDAIRGILQLRTEMAQNTQIQTNLSTVKADVGSADTAIQSAVSVLDRALTLGTQGATVTATATQRTAMAQEVGSLLEQLVSLSRTAVGGRYIFSGDQEQTPPYQVNPASPTGVDQLVTSASTRQIQDVDGLPISTAMTAQDIFDHQSAGTPAPDNVFAAVKALQVALTNNDQAGVQSSIAGLHQASDHLNVSLGFYGAAENRIQAAIDRAAEIQVQQKTDLSQQQDADIAAVSVELTMAQTQEQAALSAKAKMPPTSLFNYLA